VRLALPLRHFREEGVRFVNIVGSTIAATGALLAAVLHGSALADERQSGPAFPLQLADDSAVQQQRSEPITVAPPAPQQWSFSAGALYTHRRGETAGWAPNLAVDYTPTDRLQLHIMVPFAFDRLSGGSTHYGVGDVETGIRYRVLDDDPQGWQPAMAVYPLVDFPSGNQRENLGTGRTHAFLPLWFSKTFGSWIPYGGGGYWINPGPSNRDWGFVALGVIRVLSEQWYVTGEVFYAGSSKVTIKEQTGFDVGAHYNLNDNHQVVFTVGRGLQNATTTNEFTADLTYLLTF
jgi:hypothetical protein